MRQGESIVARPAPLGRRRAILAMLVALTSAALIFAVLRVFSHAGLSWGELAMLVLIGLNIPWVVIIFWSSVIGAVQFQRGRTAEGVPTGDDGPPAPLTTRTAIIMPARNEDPVQALAHLRVTAWSLQRAGAADHFAFYFLSDSDDAAIIAEEERLFAAWKADATAPRDLHYRRRSENIGKKAGNVLDFLDRWGDGYDHFIILDADSLMHGETVLRMVRAMQADPALGILQPLIPSLPTGSGFARVVQFGMRHTMRAYVTGSAWWQGDAAPYWGHNAIVRTRPFKQHCQLPPLPGPPPLGGLIMSHDQVEAVLIRQAGYAVRVMTDDAGSYERSPPNLPDYTIRDLRWCQGNMQYLKLLNMPGLDGMARFQLFHAIMMYGTAPLWLGFLLVGLLEAALMGFGRTGGMEVPFVTAGGLGPVDLFVEGPAVFAIVLTMALMPKLLGVFDVLVSAGRRASYGGGLRVLGGILVETLFATVMSPAVAWNQTVFIIGLFFGRSMSWDAQQRGERPVPFAEALARLWPPALLGLVAAAVLAHTAPIFLPWASPVLIGLIGAPVFAWATATPWFGALLSRPALCAMPEEIAPSPEVRKLWAITGESARHRPAPVLTTQAAD